MSLNLTLSPTWSQSGDAYYDPEGNVYQREYSVKRGVRSGGRKKNPLYNPNIRPPFGTPEYEKWEKRQEKQGGSKLDQILDKGGSTPDANNRESAATISKPTKESLLAKLSEATTARMQDVPTRESLGLLPALQSRFQPNLSPLTENRFQPTMPQIPQFSARENIRIPETPNFARTRSGAPSGGSALGLLASDKKMPSLNPTVMQAIQQGASPSQLKARQQQAQGISQAMNTAAFTPMSGIDPMIAQAMTQGARNKAKAAQSPQAGNLMALLASGQANNPTVLKAKA